jgi:hypothetical protein
MTATFDAGAPLDNTKLNELLTKLSVLEAGQTSINASITGVRSSIDTSASSAVAKKLVAGQTAAAQYTLKAGTEKEIDIQYTGAGLTGPCAAFLYSLQISGSPGNVVDVTSAIKSATEKSATIRVQKVTSGTSTYTIKVHYLAIAATA